MSNPSFSNIDMWLFELAEGNLSSDQVAKLELFLLQNPDLDVDRDVWEMAKVSAAPVVFPAQASLVKRKPVGMYAIAGSSALLLLTLVGCLSYFTLVSPELLKLEGKGSVSAMSKENKALRDEINDLKSLVTSLEGEITDSRNTDSDVHDEIDLTADSGVIGAEGTESTGTTGLTAASPTGEGIVGSGTPLIASAASGAGISGASIDTPSASGTSGPESILPITSTALRGAVAPGNADGAFAAHHGSGLLAAETLDRIALKSAEQLLTSLDAEKGTSSKSLPSDWTNTVKVDYDLSMRNRLFKWGRAIQRMVDNPVALKNSRDPHYHVPGLIAQDINFGSVGTLIAPRVQTMSRLQWQGESNELIQNQLAVDGYSYAMRGGVGVQLNHSYYNNGGLQVSSAAFTYSPKISVSRFVSVEPAFRFKMGNKLLNDSKMNTSSQVEIDRGIVHDYYNDGSQPVGRSLWYKDLGLGLNINTEWFFASAQLDNIFSHRDNLYTTDLTNPRRAGTHFVATIGTDWESRKEMNNGMMSGRRNKMSLMSLSPYLIYQKNEQLSEAWLGMNYRFYWFTVGGAISSNLEPAASVGFKLKHFSIQYNADYAYSIMNDKKSLSHQVSLRFLGKPSPIGKRLLKL